MAKRNYSAAQSTARFGDFVSSSGSADYELLNGMVQVRRKTRFLARNSGTMKRFIQLLRDNVVGENGFRVQATTPSVVDAWNAWCERPTVDGKMTMVDLCRQMVATWARDGEFFIELVVNSRFPDMLALNPIEADMVDETLNVTNPFTKNRIIMGVELDDMGAPVAYHVLTRHPGDIVVGMPLSRERHRRVPATSIIHIYDRLRPGQTRGEPPASAVINDIKMLDGYREAETMNRRIAAAMMGFFSRDLPKADGIQAFANETTKDADGEETFTLSLEPGTLKQLPDGMRFDKFDPGGSQTDYGQFESQVKKDIAMGLGISTFALGMETAGVSYSTGRSVIMEDRTFYKGLQSFFIRLGMRPVFEKWANMHVLAVGSSIAPTKLRTTVAAAKFRGRGWPWIDPAKDISANAEAIETLQTSYTQIAADRGMDVQELFAEIAADKELLKKFKLEPVSKSKPAGDESGKAKPNDDEPEQ
jgi:lambda family phage portal protein